MYSRLLDTFRLFLMVFFEMMILDTSSIWRFEICSGTCYIQSGALRVWGHFYSIAIPFLLENPYRSALETLLLLCFIR